MIVRLFDFARMIIVPLSQVAQRTFLPEKKNGARRAPSPLPEFVTGYFLAGAAALAGAAPAFAAGAAGVAGGICAGVTALPFAFISAK